ncbi:MAG: hypothetical protein AABY07_06605 [Nanoarchaeota archaeon]
MKDKEAKFIVRKEKDGTLSLEVRMSRKLRKEMIELAEKTAGTIPAISSHH